MRSVKECRKQWTVLEWQPDWPLPRSAAAQTFLIPQLEHSDRQPGNFTFQEFSGVFRRFQGFQEFSGVFRSCSDTCYSPGETLWETAWEFGSLSFGVWGLAQQVGEWLTSSKSLCLLLYCKSFALWWFPASAFVHHLAIKTTFFLLMYTYFFSRASSNQVKKY